MSIGVARWRHPLRLAPDCESVVTAPFVKGRVRLTVMGGHQMGIVSKPDVSTHVAFARAHDLHGRVSPAHLASLVAGRTVGEAFAELLAYGYQAGYADGAGAQTVAATVARSHGLCDDDAALQAEARQARAHGRARDT